MMENSKRSGIAARYLQNLSNTDITIRSNNKRRLENSPVKTKFEDNLIENKSAIADKMTTVKVHQDDFANLYSRNRLKRVKKDSDDENKENQIAAQKLQITESSPAKVPNFLDELESFNQKRKENKVGLKKSKPEALGTKPQGNKGYEYLCRITEMKQWIEQCLNEEIASTIELTQDGLRDGVILAKIGHHFAPELVKKVIPPNKKGKIEYRHTENIVNFFYFLDYIDMFDLFRFELTDLYEGKNIPKVIFCLYTVCYMISQENGVPKLDSLVGKLEFDENDIKKMERQLKGAGVPDFRSFEPLIRSLEMERDEQRGETKPKSKLNIYAEAEEENKEEEELSEYPDTTTRQDMNLNNNMSKVEISEIHEDTKIKIPKLRKKQKEDETVHFTQSTLKRVETIKKPKYSDFSVNEIEDTTIIQEHVSGEIEEDELDMALRSILQVQSLGRGFIARFQVFVKTTMLRASEEEVTVIQSMARGLLVRGVTRRENRAKRDERKRMKERERREMELEMRERQYEKRERERNRKIREKIGKEQSRRKYRDNTAKSEELVVLLQAEIRGKYFRRKLVQTLKELKRHKRQIVQFQSVIRGEISRFFVESGLHDAEESESYFVGFHTLVKGYLVRKDIINKDYALVRSTKNIIKVQCIAKGFLARQRLLNSSVIEESADDMSIFQGLIRGLLFRRRLGLMCVAEEEIVDIQSLIRAVNTRTTIKDQYYDLYKCRKEILKLQSIAKGGIARQRLTKELISMDQGISNEFESITAIIRGALLRRKMKRFCHRLKKHKLSVSELQSIIRGVLCRFSMDLALDAVWDEELSISKVQSIAKGVLLRKSIDDLESHYTANIESVIKVQSLIRAKYQNSAYRKLVTLKTPSLEIVRQFAHLANDTFKDFDEEVKLENLSHQIMIKSAENADLEKHCNEIDAKIALLVKNKITLDELMKVKAKGTDNLLKDRLRNETKSTIENVRRSRYEPFESLIYILQTCPEYLTHLFQVYRDNPQVQEEIEKMTLICFDYGGTRARVDPAVRGVMSAYKGRDASVSTRDQFMFVNMLCTSLEANIQTVKSIEDFAATSSIQTWSRLLNFFNRSDSQKKVVKKLFGPLISSISEIDNLSLESDPLKIYQEVLENEPSEKPRVVKAETAIKDPATRQKFINNLNLLREISFKVLSTVEENISWIPNHIKALCHQAYKTARTQLGSQNEALQFAMHILFETFIYKVFQSPENYDIPIITFSTNETMTFKRNLGHVSTVISQVCAMKPFSSNQVYLQPLNEFVQSSMSMMKHITRAVVEEDIESLYGMNLYTDLTARQKPSLSVSNLELLSLKNFIQEYESDIAPSKTDPIHEYIANLGQVKKISPHEYDQQVRLLLNPSLKNFAGVKTKTLMLDAKRCVLYIIQVQLQKRNLLDLLLCRISHQDELRYQEIIERDQQMYHRRASIGTESEETNEFSKSSFFRNASKMSFHNLKSHALEVLLELEALGKLSRKDKFQTILNEIANDIKTTHDQRVRRAKEISLSMQTLDSLIEKEKYLKNLLETYNKYINQSMATLQESSNTKKMTPFSKQFFYQRALRKRGKQARFGNYKYSSKYLYDHKILLEINGIKHLDLLKADFVFSCDQVGVFLIELEGGILDSLNDKAAPHFSSKVYSQPVSHITGPRNTQSRITLDDLLQTQFEGKQTISIYNGIVKFDSINLLTLIFKKFYDSSPGAVHSPKKTNFGASLTASVSPGKKHGFASSIASFGSSLGSSIGSTLRRNN